MERCRARRAACPVHGPEERDSGDEGAPSVWTLNIELYLYAHSSDPYLSPATVLNPLIDAVEAALAPSPITSLQDLGLPAMVQHAMIAGKIDTDEGALGDQAIAIIPVQILCL